MMWGRARGWLRERFYHSVAETLVLLHTAPGYDRRVALKRVADALASTLQLPLVWIGRVEPGASCVDVFAAAGAAAEYASVLEIGVDVDAPGGRGPTASALREGRARVTPVDAPEFSPWRERAVQYGFGAHLVAAARTGDGGHLVVSAYASAGVLSADSDVLDWAQRLADEMARFWDHQALLERDIRLRRYRNAQRSIQRALLEQPDPTAVYHTLAHALVEIAGAVAVDTYAVEPGDPTLTRMALCGPMADSIRRLPHPSSRGNGTEAHMPALACARGKPVVRENPAQQPDMAPEWRAGALATVGALGCWPIMAGQRGDPARRPIGVFVVVTPEADAFDAEMCGLLDEIADATGLALRQHEQRHVLFLEQARQTYLALHDDLTFLPNRRALDRHLERVLERARQHGLLLAVGVLDMDDLKPINDRYGHAVGDRVLTEVAGRIRSALRAEDYVARLGGDEFVLVFENLGQPGDLDPLLERVWHALQRPLAVERSEVKVSASLGIALFPLHVQSGGAQLLRRADQAMYAIKMRKRTRSRWWAMPPEQDGQAAELALQPDAADLKPHGPSATALLTPSLALWEPLLSELVHRFYAAVMEHAGVRRALGSFRPSDVEAAIQRMVRHLRALLAPGLDWTAQRDSALRSGTFNAAWGLEEVWLLEMFELLRGMVIATLGGSAHGDRRALEIVLQRLALEEQWQLESMRDLQRRRVATLRRLNGLAWSADSYLDLTQGAVDILVAHQEVVACAVWRPGPDGEQICEAVAGSAMTEFLRTSTRRGHNAVCLGVECAPDGAPAGASAAHGAVIRRTSNYATGAARPGWRTMAAALGIASSVAIPLSPRPETPVATLVVYSPYIGGFQSEDQQAFASQVKTLLDLALLRLAPPRPDTHLLPFFVRERWRRMVAEGEVQMHYQPVVRLATGLPSGIEALARLTADDGTLVLPGTFFPALGEGEFVELFRHALVEAKACGRRLAALGHRLDISINAPAIALEDDRYRRIAASLLPDADPDAPRLLLELLESPMGTGHSTARAQAGARELKALGLRLVQDDLGAGYSSLIRLRQWPFDRVKIDQAIVLAVVDDPLRTLRFMRQLVRLGHGLGLEVVVEGLETRGMIEAAHILGADLGQGYALAWPMPEAELTTWLAQAQWTWDRARPSTPLGLLAAALVWEEQLMAMPAHQLRWHPFAGAEPAEGARGAGHEGEAAAQPAGAAAGAADAGAADDSGDQQGRLLADRREAMRVMAARGVQDPAFQQARDAYFELLVQHVAAARKSADA